MKKILYSPLTLILGLALICVGCTPMDAVPAKWNVPGIGDVKFATTKTWKVGSQTWSDAVEVVANTKTTFDGGTHPTYKADWRNNPGQKGSLFSWTMVDDKKATLCPDGWRIPTKDDFIALGTVK